MFWEGHSSLHYENEGCNLNPIVPEAYNILFFFQQEDPEFSSDSQRGPWFQ